MTQQKSSRVVYLNGQFVPESEAKLSIYDLSVMQSAAAFEMTRSFHGVHFKLREHLDRLSTSCQLLHLSMPPVASGLEAVCQDVSARNDHGPGEEHRLLIVVSPGCAPMYRDLAGVIPHPFVYVADFPLRYTVQGFGKYFTEGVHAVTSPIQPVPGRCVPYRAKHRSRLHFHLAQQHAPAGTWPLLQNRMHWYTEAPGANLVTVRAGRIRPVATECLPGISLQTVRELMPTEDGAWHADDTPKLEELWLTGTPFCMLPVVSLDGTPIGDGTPGPLYRQTLQKWTELAGLDIAEQILQWDSQKLLTV